MNKTKHKQPEQSIRIFDHALIIQRGDYWQMRMWLSQEKRYARFSLRTRNVDTAIAKAKQQYHLLMAQQLSGKTYFSKSTRQGVDLYLKQRQQDVDAGVIVPGRYATVRTHLEHWLNFIGRDVKLRELEPTDCENYFYFRTNSQRKVPVSQVTVLNEQSTINSMVAWLYKRGEISITAFDFKPLKRIDRGDESQRRNTFTDQEIMRIQRCLKDYIQERITQELTAKSRGEIITAYYLLISIDTGLRRGEQLQLRWADTTWIQRKVRDGASVKSQGFLKITVRAETTKVRRTRQFVVKNSQHFDALSQLLRGSSIRQNAGHQSKQVVDPRLIFSVNGKTAITASMIMRVFTRVMRLARIEGIETRDLVPYSFRHYFITRWISEGATPAQVAETCGTSVLQIEQTYYHTSEERMLKNAFPEYEFAMEYEG